MTRALRWVLVALTLFVTLNAHAADDGSDGAVDARESLVPVADRRGAEQTLLTFPEWWLVNNPAEYARMMQSRPSHEFAFVSGIGQLWTGYADVTYEQLRGGYRLNPGYHVMIGVIATSTTVEYAIRAVYGNTVGRMSWALGGARATAEDRFDAETAQQYVDFIRQQPWYLFDFGARLKALWTNVPIGGRGLVRKVERRAALTTEYGAKAAYAKLIKIATHIAYDAPRMTTDVVVDRLPNDWTPPAEVKLLERYEDGRALLALPRYYDFRIAATALAQQGVRIVDIAGNTATVLVSAWAPDDRPIDTGEGRILFTQSIETPAHTTRVVMLLPVGALSTFLATAEGNGWDVEHVYDY